MTDTAQILADLDHALEQALAAGDAAGAARIRQRIAYYESDGMPLLVDNLLTVTQAAQLRGDVTDHTIRRWLRLGWLKATKYGKTWLVDKTAVMSFTPPPCGPKKTL